MTDPPVGGEFSKWKGPSLTTESFDQWWRYTFEPLRAERQALYSEMRPSRTWSAASEYRLLKQCVDHRVPVVEDAHRRVIDAGLLDSASRDNDYSLLLQQYILELREAGGSVAQMADPLAEQTATRPGGFATPPTEVARAIRRLHTMRYGTSASFREANKELFEQLTKEWKGTQLSSGLHEFRLRCQALRFHERDRLDEIAKLVEEREKSQMAEETEERLSRQQYQRLKGACREGAGYDTMIVGGRHRPLCQLCEDMGEGVQYHTRSNCPIVRAYQRDKKEQGVKGRSGQGTHMAMNSEPVDRPSSDDRTEPLEWRSNSAVGATAQGRVANGGRGSRGGRRGDDSMLPAGRCWECKDPDAPPHSYTECLFEITDPSLLSRLERIPRERERRAQFVAALAANNIPLKTKPASSGQRLQMQAEGADTTPAGMERPPSPVTDDSNQAYRPPHQRDRPSSQPAPPTPATSLRMQSTPKPPKGAGAPVKHVQWAECGDDPWDDWDDDFEQWLQGRTTMMAAQTYSIGAAPPGAGTAAPSVSTPLRAAPPTAASAAAAPARRGRGRPRVLPQGAAADPGLRMERPGWDAQREQLNHLPRGFEPAVQQEVLAGSAANSARSVTRDALDLRTQQVYHMLRSAYQNMRFHSLSTTAVTEGGPASRQRWVAARDEALRGNIDTRDHCSVAWDAALQDAMRSFHAQARLQHVDLAMIDLRSVVRAAVESVFGVQMPPDVVIPLRPQPEPVGHAAQGQAGPATAEPQPEPQPGPELEPEAEPELEPEPDDLRDGYAEPALPEAGASVSPLPSARAQPVLPRGGPTVAQETSAIVDDYLARLRQYAQGDAAGGTHVSLAYTPSARRPVARASLVEGALDLAMRKPLELASTALRTRRQAIAEHWASTRGLRRRDLAMIDTDVTRVTVGGVDVQHVLADTGCNWISISEAVARKACVEWSADAVHISGATGKRSMACSKQPVAISINPATTWEVSVAPESVVIHPDDLGLPEVIIDMGVMAGCHLTVQPGQWRVMYPVDPARLRDGGGPQAVVPLMPVPTCMHAAYTRWRSGATHVSRALPASQCEGGGGCWTLRTPHPEIAGSDHKRRSMTPTSLVSKVPHFATQRQRARKPLPLSGHSADRIQSVGALPHTDRDVVYVVNLEKMARASGKGVRALYVGPGMGTSLMQDLEDGINFEDVFFCEVDSDRRRDLQKQLEWCHRRHPSQLPRSSFQRPFSWASEVDHDAANLTGRYLHQHCGQLDEVRAELSCQDVSGYGMQLGLRGARTGAIVPFAEALCDYQYILAKERGVADWASAPAQFGYLIENVKPPPKELSPEVEEFYSFMARVFGTPAPHRPEECGSLSSRGAYWWTNMFTPGYYDHVQREFWRRPPVQFHEVVDTLSGGKLRPQTVTPEMVRGCPLNVVGQPQAVQPKYVSRYDNVMQVMQDDATPGAGMLEVVGTKPVQFVPTPATIREVAVGAPQGFYTRPELGLTEREQCQVIGNICSPISVSVMNRVRVGYAHQRQFEAFVKLNVGAAVSVGGPSVQRRACEESEKDAQAMLRTTREYEAGWKAAAESLQLRRVQDAAAQSRMSVPRQDVGLRLQINRAVVASKVHRLRGPHGGGSQASLVGSGLAPPPNSPLFNLLMLCSSCYATAYSVGASIGVEFISSLIARRAVDSGVLPTAGQQSGDPPPSQCYVSFGNSPASGLPEDVKMVPSKLVNTKEGSEHTWRVGASFQAAEQLAEVMDTALVAWGLHDLREVHHEPYEFELQCNNPVFRRQYHLAYREAQFAEEWVKELEKYGLVEETNSPWAAPVVVAQKKDESGAWTDLRYAIDYRGLNNATVRDQYPCPTAEDIMSRMQGAQLFTVCDAQKAFHSLPVSERCKPMMAFHAGSRLMTWNRMPFGHKNSVAAWQRVVDDALRGLDCAAAFADDIIIWSGADEQEHINNVRIVLARLRRKGVQLSPKKCSLGMKRIEFLGHVVSGDGVEPQWSKVEAISQLAPCRNVPEVRSFLGLATYYCKFLPHFSHVKAPLTQLTKKNVPWRWTAVEQSAFEEIKQLLVSATVLRNPDWSRPFILHTDWSKLGVGAVLSQVDSDGVEYAVCYASRMNSAAEAVFSSYEGEVSAVVWAVQRMRYWLWGRQPFTLVTDCKAMEWLRTTARLRSKIARWSLILAEYDFTVQHRPGVENAAPDLLSRQPAPPVAADAGLANLLSASPTEDVAPWLQRAARDTAALFVQGPIDAVVSWPRHDIWESPQAINYVRGVLRRHEVTPEQWSALARKCAPYSFSNGKIWRRIGRMGGVKLEVPPPAERQDIIHSQHKRIGHLGRDRTYNMLTKYFHWPGMHQDVTQAVKNCRVCSRAKAHFSAKHDRLQPMPIFGMFYRFSVDSAGDLRPSNAGYTYVVVIVEHFSKWVDLVPVKSLDPRATAGAFKERVLARYGAPVEVVTDNGQEYRGEFDALLREHGIDHVEIPAGHPSTNGMAERIVGVLKEALRKFISTSGLAAWDAWLPVIEFGYRVTKQQRTGFSPYFLMYGREPVSPHQQRAHMLAEQVDVEDPQQMLDLVSQRADVMRSAMPRAFERALAAQARDVIRFRKVRRGDVRPRTHRFEEGHFVYYTQRPINTLDMRATRTILRVQRTYPSGWLTLEGADGNTIDVHADQCAPCSLSNLVPAKSRAVDAATDQPVQCAECGRDSRSDALLLCDKCGKAVHVGCLPSLPTRYDPESEWLCAACEPPPAVLQ